MKAHYPRIVAGTAFLIGMIGFGVSLPLLAGIKTSLFFLLGLGAWAFLCWRAFSCESREIFIHGWIWSILLHFTLLPLCVFLPRILGTELPITELIFVMLILSIVGLILELRISTSGRPKRAQDKQRKEETEQGGDGDAEEAV